VRNDIRVSAHPYAACRDLAQQRVEPRPVFAGAEGVDPHQYAIDGEQASANSFFRLLGKTYRLGRQPNVVETGEDQMKARCARRRRFRYGISAPNQRDPANWRLAQAARLSQIMAEC